MPNLIDGYLNLAASHIKAFPEGEERLASAEAALGRATKLDSSCPQMWYWFARLEQSRSKPDFSKAEAQVDKAGGIAEGLFTKAELLADERNTERDLKASAIAWRRGLNKLPISISIHQFDHMRNLWYLADSDPGNLDLRTAASEAKRHVEKNCPWRFRSG